ncbi:MAG: response regulator transcription factor [Myxococcales bacterium]|jgi:DNA-binding response OmpR family regulator|nr:response regulator transcription factor [Myxococcales bacterium]
MAEANRILVVEDDKKLSGFLTRVLTEEGYTVDLATTGTEALGKTQGSPYAAIVLDWMLPEADGLAVCKDVRARGDATPILMLTARGETSEKVLGLDSGVDDYMVKPFEVEELVARVRALVRRSQGTAKLRAADLEIDRVAHRASLGGTPLSLTSREYALLVYLVAHADAVVSRGDLLTHVWETSLDPGSNLIEVHVSRLREKLGEKSWMIETVRGAGYRLRTRPAAP